MNKVRSSLKFQIFILQLVVTLTYIGLALPYSIFSVIYADQSQSDNLLIYSLIITTYPLGQALGMLLFGDLSDRYGRKKILQATLVGAAITFYISGLCITYHWSAFLIIIRFFCGAFEGNSAIALAIVSDLNGELKNKAKFFGKINIALTLGFMIGPFLGSFFSNPQIVYWFNYSTPFYLAGVWSLLTLAVVTLFFAESYHVRSTPFSLTKLTNMAGNNLRNIFRLFKRNGLKVLIYLNLIAVSGIEIIYQFIPVYLVNKWSASTEMLAYGVLLLSVGKLFGNSYLLNTFNRHIKLEFNSIWVSLLAVIFCIVSLISVSSLVLFFCLVFVLGIFISIVITNLITIISNLTSRYSQGSVLSALQGLRLFLGTIMCNLAALSCQISFQLPFIITIIFCTTAFIICFNIALYKNFGRPRTSLKSAL